MNKNFYKIFLIIFLMTASLIIACNNNKENTEGKNENNSQISEEEINKNTDEETVNNKENPDNTIKLDENIISDENNDGITYGEVVENTTSDDKLYTLSEKTDDLTIILAYGLAAKSISEGLKNKETVSVICSVAKQSMSNIEENFNNKFSDVVKYCKGKNKYSDKNECKLILKVNEECF